MSHDAGNRSDDLKYSLIDRLPGEVQGLAEEVHDIDRRIDALFREKNAKEDEIARALSQVDVGDIVCVEGSPGTRWVVTKLVRKSWSWFPEYHGRRLRNDGSAYRREEWLYGKGFSAQKGVNGLVVVERANPVHPHRVRRRV